MTIAHSILILWFFFLIEIVVCIPLNISNSKLKIAGGEPADIKDFPYQVALSVGNGVCGGAILNERFILSAAHCTYDVEISEMIVRVGSNYRNAGGSEYTVTAAFQHKGFDPETFDNDIVILKLAKALTFNEKVAPISVVPAGYILEDNRLATVTGYGLLSPKGPIAQSLQKVELPLITTKTCQQIYGADQITDRMFCAGYAIGGKDACPGDSGGAIVLEGQVIGIVSFGPDCAAPNEPGAYTKVSEFRSFIDSIIANS